MPGIMVDRPLASTAMLSVSPEVAGALAAGRAVVALESTIVSHGLPRPDNVRIAREIEDAVRAFSRNDSFLANNPPRVTFNCFLAEVYVLDEASDAEAVLGHAHKAATGTELESFMTAGYLDTRVHALYDRVPALCYGPISRNIRGFDEAVSLASLKRITTTMALFVAEWCGVEPVA